VLHVDPDKVQDIGEQLRDGRIGETHAATQRNLPVLQLLFEIFGILDQDFCP